MRRLATIQKISELRPIKDADKIEVALMENLGWECVVKKGEFKVGDKIIYVEVDSVMPDKPEYEFLRDRKFRIRIIKLKGQVSMGLILPISSLGFNSINFRIGIDVTEQLGITKYLSPTEQDEANQEEIRLRKSKNVLVKYMMRYSWFRKLMYNKKLKGGWPQHISKTDELRCQNLHWNEFYENFKDKEVYITEKIDGQSFSATGKMIPKFNGFLGKLFPKKKFDFIVCSRNMRTNDKSTLYWKIAEKYNIEKLLRDYPNLTIQGEQGDTKVQGNKYGIKEPTMWVFNIINISGYQYNYIQMKLFCEKHNLNTVPLLKICRLSDLGSTVPELVEFSKGKSLINPNVQREGIVIRCIENGNKLFSFKVINPNFLLKYNDE